MDADELIYRNRRLVKQAEATCALTRMIIDEVAENRLRLHLALLRIVHLRYGRQGRVPVGNDLLRQSIAHESPDPRPELVSSEPDTSLPE